MSRGQDFLGCSQDVLHRNQTEEDPFCNQENWQGAVICLAQVCLNIFCITLKECLVEHLKLTVFGCCGNARKLSLSILNEV